MAKYNIPKQECFEGNDSYSADADIKNEVQKFRREIELET